MNENGPQTLIEAVRYFSDKKVCHDYMVQIKWPDGKIVCPKCASDNIGIVATRDIWKCRSCKKQFSAKVDTIFEQSPLGLDKWFPALVASVYNVHSTRLAALLDITQKSAWLMLHRIRLAREIAMDIEYRELAGYPNYRVGSDGSVWTKRNKIGNRWVTGDWRLMRPTVHDDGYRYVTLYAGGKARSRKVSVMVAEEFIGPKPAAANGRVECCHGNGDRTDDRRSNLSWGTSKENAADRRRHGMTASGERNGFAKLTDTQVMEILALRGKLSQEKIGKMYGVSQVHIGRIFNGEARLQPAQ